MNEKCNGWETTADDYTRRLRLGTPFVSHAELVVTRPCPDRLTKTKTTQKH